MKILVIEDDSELSMEIVDYLRRSHHDVEACGTVAAARAALEGMLAGNAPPHAVLCDAGLPDGDGAELYRGFAPRTPTAQWFLMSGGNDFGQIEGGPGSGRPPIIVDKPVSLRHLQRLLSGDAQRPTPGS